VDKIPFREIPSAGVASHVRKRGGKNVLSLSFVTLTQAPFHINTKRSKSIHHPFRQTERRRLRFFFVCLPPPPTSAFPLSTGRRVRRRRRGSKGRGMRSRRRTAAASAGTLQWKKQRGQKSVTICFGLKTSPQNAGN